MIASIAIAAILAIVPIATEPTMEYVGTYSITAYSYEEGGGENYYTAGGYTPTPYYTVATGNEFEFGTILFIEDVGEVQVQDRGGFPSGIIDLHVGHDDPEEWGVREKKVYLVKE